MSIAIQETKDILHEITKVFEAAIAEEDNAAAREDGERQLAGLLQAVDALDELKELTPLRGIVDLFVYRTNNIVHELASLKRELGQ